MHREDQGLLPHPPHLHVHPSGGGGAGGDLHDHRGSHLWASGGWEPDGGCCWGVGGVRKTFTFWIQYISYLVPASLDLFCFEPRAFKPCWQYVLRWLAVLIWNWVDNDRHWHVFTFWNISQITVGMRVWIGCEEMHWCNWEKNRRGIPPNFSTGCFMPQITWIGSCHDYRSKQIQLLRKPV